MFGSLGNMASLLKQAQEIPKLLKEMQEKLAQMSFDGDAGAGAVAATVNGKMELIKLHIQPDLMKADEREMLEDLIVAAVNAAQAKAKVAVQEETSKITGGMNLPGLQGLLGN